MYVCGIEVDPSWVAVAAELFGGRMYDCENTPPLPEGVAREDIIALHGATTESAFAKAIMQGSKVTYVLDQDFDITALCPPHALFDAPSLIVGICASARSAYELSLAPVLSEMLLSQGHITERAHLNVEIALSEAISNALVHGSLKLESPEERFDPAFITAIEERIADPDFGSRPIWIAVYLDGDTTLRVSVADEGSGYTPGPALDLNDPKIACRGRGLIHAATNDVTYMDNGRCLEMKFSL